MVSAKNGGTLIAYKYEDPEVWRRTARKSSAPPVNFAMPDVRVLIGAVRQGSTPITSGRV
jgi:hypothetical protein